MKYTKLIVEALVGLVVAFAIMWYRGAFSAKDAQDVILAIGDGFTVVAVLYLGIGAMMWVSTTGMFDIFGYAVKRGMHALLPGMFVDPSEDDYHFYEYKVKKQEKRKKGISIHSTLVVGAVFLILSIIFTVAWYGFE